MWVKDCAKLWLIYAGIPPYKIAVAWFTTSTTAAAAATADKYCYHYFWFVFYLPSFLGLLLSLLNLWPLWAVEAGDYSPSMSVICELNGFWQCAVAPVCDIIRPSSCWSFNQSLTVHHSQHHCFHQSLILYSADVPKQSQFSLLYQIYHTIVSFNSLSDGLITNSVFPAHFQYPSITPHLECQQLSRWLG